MLFISIQQLDVILRRYDAGESANAIAKSIGMSVTTLRRTLNRRGVEKNKTFARSRLTDAETKAALAMGAAGGRTLQEIADNIGKSKQTVFRLFKKNDLNLPMGRPRSCTVDDTAFDALTPKSLYWMGFMFADGCVSGDDNGSPWVAVHLAEKDREQVEKFRAFLGSSHAITWISQFGKKTGKRHRLGGPSVYFKVRSKSLVRALEICGMGPKKAKRRPSDALLASKDFWRGVIDGDGWLGTVHHSEKISPYVGICGQDFFVECFLEFLRKYLDIRDLNLSPTDSGIWKTQTEGESATRIIHMLYDKNEEALDRKNARAQAIIRGDLYKFPPYVEEPSKNV